MWSTLLSFLLNLILKSFAGNIFRRWQYTIVGSKVTQPRWTVGCEGFYGSQSNREISGHQVSLYTAQFCLVNAFTCKQYKFNCGYDYMYKEFAILREWFINNIYIQVHVYWYRMQTKKTMCSIHKCKLVMKLYLRIFYFSFGQLHHSKSPDHFPEPVLLGECLGHCGSVMVSRYKATRILDLQDYYLNMPYVT